MNNNSKLSLVLNKKTCQSLLTVEFSTHDIVNMIRYLNLNKDESICKPLAIIFQSCLQNGEFPSEWKKANVVPVFKEKKKQVKNYDSISLLPVSSKIFERLLYDSMFKFHRE